MRSEERAPSGASKPAVAPIYSGYSFADGFEEFVLHVDRNSAKRLGNLERLKRCEALKEFSAARAEWLRAWRIMLSRQKLSSLNAQTVTSVEAKRFLLEFLRRSHAPGHLLQKHWQLIALAAHEGDVEFFRQMAAAFRGHDRRTPREFSVGFHILSYWFNGLLWLMNAEAGSRALRAYLKRESDATGSNVEVPIDGYHKACRDFGLRGYKAFMTRPPITRYRPKQHAYDYAPGWQTKLEPNASI